MSLNLTCFFTNENLFNLTNKSNWIFEHEYSQLNRSFFSKLSLFLSNSLFSSNDFEILFQNFLLNQSKLPTKFVSSILIYSILILILFVTLVILFYIISYSTLKSTEYLIKSRLKYIYLFILMIFSFYFLIEMIFLIEDLNHLKNSLEKSFDYLKKEFHSKLFVKHLNELFIKLQNLKTDENLFDSIEQFLKKFFLNFLNKNYSIDKLNKYLNNINEFIRNNSLNDLFDFYLNLIENINQFNSNLCFYFNENYLEFEKDFSKIFSSIEKQFEILIEILNEQILTKINWKFFNENQIYSIINLITNLTILCLAFLTLIPICFFILITINYFSLRFRLKNRKIRSELALSEQTSQSHRLRSILSKKFPRTNQFKKLNEINLKKYQNSIRICFGFLTIFLIILCILNGLIYAFDLFLQSFCRLIHHDQSFFVSLFSDNLMKSIDEIDLNKTIHNLLNDCNRKIPFSRKFVNEISFQFSGQIISILNNFNRNFENEFRKRISIENLNLQFDILRKVSQFTQLNQRNFYEINLILNEILQKKFSLSNQFLIESLEQFELFVEEIFISRIDMCPLPMKHLIKADFLICHQTTKFLNGLWLKILFFTFFLVCFLCIFPIYLYKRLN